MLDLIVADAPTPLLGLESFSLRAAPIREIYAQGDQVVLRSSAGNGGAHYVVETASGLDEPMVWTQVPVPPTLIEIYDSPGYLWADWLLTNQVTSPAAYYRIRLLDP